MVLKIPGNPNYPAQVVGVSPHVVTKAGGVYTHSIDLPALSAALLALDTAQTRIAISDAAYAVVAPIKFIAYIGLTQTRNVTLAPASAYRPGTEIDIADESGACSPTVKIHVQATGTENINGGTSMDIEMPYGLLRLISNGVDRYLTYP